MDILDFINKEEVNSRFNSKYKKNIQVGNLIAQDLQPDNDAAVNMAVADGINQYSIDSKTADKYRARGINWNPWDNLDAQFAEEQGIFSN